MTWLPIILGTLLAICTALLAFNYWCAKRFVHWIADPTASTMPNLPGTWGIVSAYTRRAFRKEQSYTVQSTKRLDELLAALNALPAGIVLLDSQGRILFCNKLAASHFGLEPDQDRGQHIVHLVRDPMFLAWYAALDASPTETRLEIPGRFDTPGSPVRLMLERQPYGDNCSLLLSTDITAQRQIETMRRDFVANVSHEIRTPLTVLAGFVETLQSLELSDEEKQHFLALMAKQAKRMQALVEDLLTLSRLEDSPLPGLDQRIDLCELTAHCASDAQALSVLLYGGKTQRIDVNLLVDFDLAGAVSELQSAMNNLLANAVRYCKAQGVITANWSRLDDGSVRFEVTDNGIGIAPEHLSRLTERFYRVDRSRARHSQGADGTGLGLAIVRHVAGRHGGTLQITSVLGQGSCFALTFPKSRVLPRIAVPNA
jgi:two-component system phosphate regulon sensor histidine kinase PhoR